MKKLSGCLIALILSAVNLGYAELYSQGLDTSFYTSDFMIGEVVVSIIFPESDGSFDPNIENWDNNRKTQVLGEIMAGLSWWTKQNPRSPLQFTFVSNTISTKYEPIIRPYYAESMWIPDVMGKLGYSGSRFTACRDYVNDLRTTHETDWGFVIFVVDSLLDPNGKLADGYFAYAYLGGPYMVMTYDNNGYGIGNMDVVTAHEVGHIFHALDQYAGASSPSSYSFGYFPTINGNHVYSYTANEPNSIMRGGLRWGLDDWTRRMIGWRDQDNNGYDDIVDQSPNTGILTSVASNEPQVSSFSGEAKVSVLPRQDNPNGFGFTVDSIAKVEYRLAGEDWEDAFPVDGVFDSGEERFQIMVHASSLGVAQTVQTTDVEIRVTTAYELLGGGDGSNRWAPGTLSTAHAFPNPFKPNSNLDHVDITFTGLTPGAKVLILTPAGEPLYEKTTDAAGAPLTWNAENNSGSKVSSGVYYYLITDEEGNKKKGKIAVVR